MTGILMLLVHGLAAGLAIVLFGEGYRQLRSDSADGLNLDELMILRPEQRRAARGEGPIGRLATALAPKIRKRLPRQWVSWLQTQVDLAGRPDGATVDTVIRGIAFWALLLSPAIVIFAIRGNFIGLVLCFIAAPFLPLVRLSRARRLRRESLDRDLPDFLDILAVTVTAGVAFRPALGRVSSRFDGPIANEFQLALNQIQNGASVRGAFEQLRQRSDSEALSQFVTAFLQSNELGAPLADSLQTIAIDMRREHAQRMRRKAARVAPRVTLVTSLVLVPGTLILLITGMILGSDVNFGELLQGFQ